MVQLDAMKVLRLNETLLMTGLKRSTLYLYIKEGRFPKPIKLGSKSSGWLQEEVQKWIEGCANARQ